MRSESGFVATEFVVAVALLLIPTLLLVASSPQWIERRHVATVVAREAATVASESFPSDTAAAEAVAVVVAANYGVAPEDVSVRVVDDARRGGQVRAEVTITMPAIVVPFVGQVGRWRYTTEYTVRIDDFRSRT